MRRYLLGPPGPQGPPGPPGTSGGLSGSYGVEEIATYVFNIMNSKHRWHCRQTQQKTITLEVVLDFINQSNCFYCHFQAEGSLEVRPGHPVLLGLLGLLLQGALASLVLRLTILN